MADVASKVSVTKVPKQTKKDVCNEESREGAFKVIQDKAPGERKGQGTVKRERKVKKTNSRRVSPEEAAQPQNGDEKMTDLAEAAKKVGKNEGKMKGVVTEIETANKAATTVSGGIKVSKEVTKVDSDIIKSTEGVKPVAVEQGPKTIATEKPSLDKFSTPPQRSNHACRTNPKGPNRPSMEHIIGRPKRFGEH